MTLPPFMEIIACNSIFETSEHIDIDFASLVLDRDIIQTFTIYVGR